MYFMIVKYCMWFILLLLLLSSIRTHAYLNIVLRTTVERFFILLKKTKSRFNLFIFTIYRLHTKSFYL